MPLLRPLLSGERREHARTLTTDAARGTHLQRHDRGLSMAQPAPAPKLATDFVPPGPWERTTEKPPYSYATLIAHAIQSSPQKRLTLSEIYAWIEEHYPFFRPDETSWKNSIRHNLSLKHCFMKVARTTDKDRGKGAWWTIDTSCALDAEKSRRKRAHSMPPPLGSDGWSQEHSAAAAAASSTATTATMMTTSMHPSTSKGAGRRAGGGTARKRTKSTGGPQAAAFARSISLDGRIGAGSDSSTEESAGAGSPKAARDRRRSSLPYSLAASRKRAADRPRRPVAAPLQRDTLCVDGGEGGHDGARDDPMDAGAAHLIEMAVGASFDDMESLQRLGLVSLTSHVAAPLSPEPSVANAMSPSDAYALQGRLLRMPMSPERSPPGTYAAPAAQDHFFAPPAWRPTDDFVLGALSGPSDYRRFVADMNEGGEAPFSAELNMLFMTCDGMQGDAQMHVAELPRPDVLPHSMTDLLAAASS